jgi:hypothetical protein
MAFSIESTYDGRGLFAEDCIASGTLVSGELIALTAGAGKPTATACGATAKPDGIVDQGATNGNPATFVRILPGDIMVTKAMAADGSTALSAAEVAAHTALVGSQAQRIAAGSLFLDGVTVAGGTLELISFDPSTCKSRVRVTIAS